MQLSVDKIKYEKGLELNFDLEEDLVCMPEENFDFSFADKVKFSGKIVNQGNENYLLHGRYETTISYKCCRCLKPCSMPVSGDTEAYFTTVDVLDDDEVDMYQFDGISIALDMLIINDIAFDLPMKMLCKEDCLGLCPYCGIDLNNNACTCRDDNIDPRWEKLKGLKFITDK